MAIRVEMLLIISGNVFFLARGNESIDKTRETSVIPAATRERFLAMHQPIRLHAGSHARPTTSHLL